MAATRRCRDSHPSPCPSHAFSSPVPFLSRLAHYCRLRDVQTLAMLCSVFEAQSRPQGIPNPFGPFPSRSSNLVVSHSRYVSWGCPGVSLTFPGGRRHREWHSHTAPVCSAAQLYILWFLLEYVRPRIQHWWLEHRLVWNCLSPHWVFLFFFFKTSLLEYNCFTMVC